MGTITTAGGHMALTIGLALTALPLLAEPPACRPHEVLTETVMPHLEENLRHTITREKRCLMPGELPNAFPILTHSSLRGCRLGNESRSADKVAYTLLCDGSNGTTGTALWEKWNGQTRGTLQVKLGGKNMTFSQRITATPLDTGSLEIR
ncbi:hypothetical protein [Noviherbaspirillum sp. Root189]|uniref:hypothetical protein n=1 Tax=Noviherbaspirillum sp. Root189 TaxID=1736487 RepID=UPI00071010FC|nr:hypothetical protein [Noviherbaspirillum sp. Root189]KRB70552.1 hypothetical protein ASE07_08075 [Noviherbaspirillum sp. Root189]